MKNQEITPFKHSLRTGQRLKCFPRPVAFWKQIVYVLCWLYHGIPSAQALWIPDDSGAPTIWLQVTGEPATAPFTPVMEDQDGNGVADWSDAFQAAIAAGTINYWSGGTFMIDGVITTLGGVWHGSTIDSDGDQIPDDLDPYPSDPSNRSFYWTGGSWTLYGITHAFKAGWYAGNGTDADNNGLPDVLEDWFTTPSAHGTLQHWQGGTFSINGQSSTFNAVSYYSPLYTDMDGDGIPDELDPYPADPWNNSNFHWSGGDYPINGVMTHFPPSTFGGTWVDSDGDGIPDQADPLPYDAINNSQWWQGGTFTIDGAYVTIQAQWHRADVGDSDSDGLPDDLDPSPNSPDNWHTFQWAGGTFRINNQDVIYGSGTYFGLPTDSDGDGIPDVVDPWPNDANNANVTAQYTWAGGRFMVDNHYQFFSSETYSGTWMDSDGDGIPDAADPYPFDSSNGNTTTFWSGGWFSISNQSTFFPAGDYAGTGSDSDGDGIPDSCDPFPTDPQNGNQTFVWGGGAWQDCAAIGQ